MVSQEVVAKGHTGDPLAHLGHQIVYDTIEEIRSGHTALSDPAVDGELAKVLSVHTSTTL